MCGIAGIVHTNGSPAAAVSLERMVNAIRHRGPDDSGVYVHENAGLGHCRLATLDLSPHASQPMVSADGRFVLAYNGMIYNFLELRAELQALGFAGEARGDTAVLLRAWQAWGEDCLTRLNGHFAFALLDKKKRCLYLARDRFGTRPLYWTHRNGSFLFASEIKGLLAHRDCPKSLDTAALPEYFTFQNFFTDRTLFRHVRLFPRASLGRLALDGGELQTRRYWDYRFRQDESPLRREEYVEELDLLMQRAVARNMVADVEVGAYLSGGIDSGLLTSLAVRDTHDLKTFTCGFDLSSASGMEMGFDERVRAEAMSAAFRTEHYEMVLKSGDMERAMPKVMRHLEEPRVGQCYPNYYLARLAGKFVRIVISGAGGDELFAGYPWRYYRVAGAKNFDEFAGGYYRFWQRLVAEDTLPRFLAPAGAEADPTSPARIFREVFDACDSCVDCPADAINLSLYFEASTFLQGLLLVEDKLSMANGLETRAPFLDNDVVDFAMRCPPSRKLQQLQQAVSHDENAPGVKSDTYWRRTRDGKRILRDVARRHIPGHCVEAEKQGFSAPDGSWFKGESMAFVKRRLFRRQSPIYQVIDYDTATGLVAEHLAGQRNRRLLIWSLLCFDYWFDTFNM